MDVARPFPRSGGYTLSIDFVLFHQLFSRRVMVIKDSYVSEDFC
jgi:hypothetical protein